MTRAMEGRIHTWTRCMYAGERFAADVPYTLVLVEFDGVDAMTMGRLEGAEDVQIGMKVMTHPDEELRYTRFVPL